MSSSFDKGDIETFKFYTIIAFPVLVLSLFGIIIGIDMYYSYLRFSDEGIITDAEIIRIDRKENHIDVEYRYQVNDRQYSAKERVSADGLFASLAVGQHVSVYYLPDNHAESVLVSIHENEVPAFGIVLGVFMLTLSGSFFLYGGSVSWWQRTRFEKWTHHIGQLFFFLIPCTILVGLKEAFDLTGATGCFYSYVGVAVLAISGLSIYLWRKECQPNQHLEDARSRHSIDISQREIPYPTKKQQIEQTLSMLGFERLGEVAVIFPSGKEFVEWCFKNPDSTIVVEVTAGKIPMVQFATWFADDILTETSYPVGERIRESRFVKDFNEIGISEAYQTHLHHVETLYQKYGSPQPISTIEEFVRRDTLYREMAIMRVFRRAQTVSKLRQFFALALIVYTISMILAIFWLDMIAFTLFMYMASLLLGILHILPGWLELYRRRPPSFFEQEVRKQKPKFHSGESST